MDWGKVRAMGTRHQMERHLALLLAMTVDAFPDLSVPQPDQSVGVQEKRLAWRLMTSNPVTLGEARDRQETAGAGASHWIARLFPSPRRLKATQGQGTTALQYAHHYRRLATERLPRMLGRSDIGADLRAMVDWLGD